MSQVPAFNFDITDNPESRGGLGAGEHTVGSPRPSIPVRATARGSGTANLPPDVAALLLVCGWLESINAVLAAATASGGSATTIIFPHGGVWPSSTAAGQALLGHPVVLGARRWREVASLAVGDVGARPYLQAHGQELVLVAGVGLGEPGDLDHPGDLPT